MTIYKVADLIKRIQVSTKKFKTLTDHAIQEVDPDLIKEIEKSLILITNLSTSEINRLINILSGPTEYLNNCPEYPEN